MQGTKELPLSAAEAAEQYSCEHCGGHAVNIKDKFDKKVVVHNLTALCQWNTSVLEFINHSTCWTCTTWLTFTCAYWEWITAVCWITHTWCTIWVYLALNRTFWKIEHEYYCIQQQWVCSLANWLVYSTSIDWIKFSNFYPFI